ncbi:MAG: hypothetical protein QT05_C0051G0049 [archaeon GW2011_AR13]|nr:MAG: hypothetical protein QT05_C0051G0049 [archaeon GW2011_AR13]HIG94874.1 hypothetical protein [Nanoarchaeota archaeon]HIH63626.1 hypothetical protein [Nanoarchaeota archaeon]HIJ10119.1 hypothetical protein [Nanoarchaeota archaeon]
MITLNKSMIIIPHEEMIKKLEQTRVQRMLLCKDLNKYMGSNINANFKRDKNGRPSLYLTPLDKTVVQTISKKEYWDLMRVCECADWKWESENKPTTRSFWEMYGKKTCISVQGKVGFSSIEFYESINYKIIQSKEFYDIEGVTNSMIEEINQWFKFDF